MKPVYKFLVPLFVLALLAVGVVGNVFAQNSLDFNSGSRETEVVGVVEAIAPGSWTIDGKVYQVTPATEIKGMIQTGMRVKVHASTDANGVLTAREIELVASNVSMDGRNNSGVTGTDDRHSANEMEIYGTVESINGTAWKIDGKSYLVTAATEIKGLIQVGARVKVHLIQNADGALTIREVELAGVDASRDGRSNDDRSGDDDSRDDKSSWDKSDDDHSDDNSNDKSHNGYDDHNRDDDDDHNNRGYDD